MPNWLSTIILGGVKVFLLIFVGTLVLGQFGCVGEPNPPGGYDYRIKAYSGT